MTHAYVQNNSRISRFLHLAKGKTILALKTTEKTIRDTPTSKNLPNPKHGLNQLSKELPRQDSPSPTMTRSDAQQAHLNATNNSKSKILTASILATSYPTCTHTCLLSPSSLTTDSTPMKPQANMSSAASNCTPSTKFSLTTIWA